MVSQCVFASLRQNSIGTELSLDPPLHGSQSSKRPLWDLEQAFPQIWNEFRVWSEIAFRVVVEGIRRPVCPSIWDELYLVCHEALSNAVRHSRAGNVEVELEYSPRQLRVVVRDNGDGIDAALLRSRCTRHWGLASMKEGAQKIGGKLRILSHAGAGTEVELSIPAQSAFDLRQEERSAGWLSRLFATRETALPIWK